MMSDDMDDYDFTPSTNTTLASLFNTTMQLPKDATLMYQAPKQPKLKIEELKNEPSKSDSKVFCAITVNLWKLENQQYVLLGQHMLAVIGSETQKIYEIIMYKDKKQVVVRSKICGMNLIKQDNNFATFYDDINQNWLIRFNNDEDCNKLSENIEKYGGKSEKQSLNSPAKVSSESQMGPQTDDTAKADILTRIAKMGQAMIPSFSKIHTENDTEPITSKIEPTSKISDIKLPHKHTKSTEIVKFPEKMSPLTNRNISEIEISTSSPVPVCYDPMNIFLSENRANNSEIRLNIAQISTKLDQILNMSDCSPQDETLKSKVKVLELRTENLLTELKNYELKCLKLEEKLEEQENKSKIDKPSKIQLDMNEKYQETLKENLKKLTEITEEQKKDLENYRRLIEENRSKLNESQTEIERLNTEITDLKKVGKTNGENSNTEKSNLFVGELKQTMNWMFNNIVNSFEDSKQYSSAEIQNIIAPHIKLTTFKVIQQFQQNFRNEEEL